MLSLDGWVIYYSISSKFHICYCIKLNLELNIVQWTKHDSVMCMENNAISGYLVTMMSTFANPWSIDWSKYYDMRYINGRGCNIHMYSAHQVPHQVVAFASITPLWNIKQYINDANQ